jgi:hypothetical protein
MTSAVDAGCLMLKLAVIVAGAAAVCVVLAEGGAVSHAYCYRLGSPPIHDAANGGQLSCLNFLVARDADVNAKRK